MAKPPFKPSNEEVKAAFQNSMFYEIAFTFGVPAHDPLDYAHWEMINFTRMADARLLYYFFEKTREGTRDPDVLAADFGYPAHGIALATEDRDRLNKDLLHFSHERLRHSRETKPWPNSILGNLLDPVLGFMRHIRENRPDLFDSIEERVNWSRLLELIEAGRELRIRVLADVDNRPRYDFHLGLPLPSGKPVLTQFIPSSVIVPGPGTSTTGN